MVQRKESSPLFVDAATLSAELGLRRSTIKAMVKAGTLLQPLRTGKAQSAKRIWRRSEIEAALERMRAGAA